MYQAKFCRIFSKSRDKRVGVTKKEWKQGIDLCTSDPLYSDSAVPLTAISLAVAMGMHSLFPTKVMSTERLCFPPLSLASQSSLERTVHFYNRKRWRFNVGKKTRQQLRVNFAFTWRWHWHEL
jgi:hypothetical protein